MHSLRAYYADASEIRNLLSTSGTVRYRGEGAGVIPASLRRRLGAPARQSLESWLAGLEHDGPMSSNVPSQRLPFQRWYRFKEAFSPLLVAEAMSTLGFWPTRCLDCFGGSGTTALTCQFLGIEPTTIEVNPFLADLIEAKLARYDVQGLLADYGEVIDRSAREGPRLDGGSAQWPPTMVEPGLDGRWIFPQDTFRRIRALAQSIAAVQDAQNRRLMRVLLGSIVVEMSNVTISGKGRRYRGNWREKQKRPTDVSAAFRRAFDEAFADITVHGHRSCTDYRLLRGDARQCLVNVPEVDVALFSPPYPNSFDYTDIYNVELWALGYLRTREENTRLRNATLRSHVQIGRDMSWGDLRSKSLVSTVRALKRRADQLWNPRIPDMIGAYFADLYVVLSRIRAKLNPDGAVMMTVGDSRYAGVLVDVGRVLSEMAPAVGYRCESIRPIRSMRSSAQQGWAQDLNETLVCLRPG